MQQRRAKTFSAGSRFAIRPKAHKPCTLLAQAALRRAAALRRGVRAVARRRALPARLLRVRFALGRRAAFVLAFFFTIFAICCSLFLFHCAQKSAH